MFKILHLQNLCMHLTFSLWASLLAQLVKNPPAMQVNPGSIPGLGRSPGEGKGYSLQYSWTSLVAQMVKNLPAMRETWVWSLGWEDLLKKRKATHYIFWPGEFHGLYGPWGHKELDTIERLSLSPLSLAVPSIWMLVNNHIPPKANLIQCSEHISYSKKSQKEYHFINSCEGIL